MEAWKLSGPNSQDDLAEDQSGNTQEKSPSIEKQIKTSFFSFDLPQQGRKTWMVSFGEKAATDQKVC